MFDNRFTEDERPICPLCNEVIPERATPDAPAPAELIRVPKGLFLMHVSCVTSYNESVQMLRDAGFKPTS
jgi:hypothetical protein